MLGIVTEVFDSCTLCTGTLLRGDGMDKFEWDDDESVDQNFRRWAIMNDDERETFKLARLTDAEARRLFNELRKSGWLTM